MNPQPPVDPPCSTILYRTVWRKEWFDPDDATRVKAEAFMRRPPKITDEGVTDPMDQDGLSVFDASRIDPQACIEETRRCFGVVTLHVGTLRNLGLNLVRDAEDYRKILITNIPFENPNEAEQESLLDAVADSVRIERRCNHRRRN